MSTTGDANGSDGWVLRWLFKVEENARDLELEIASARTHHVSFASARARRLAVDIDLARHVAHDLDLPIARTGALDLDLDLARDVDPPRLPRGTPRNAPPKAPPWTVRRVSLTPEEERAQATRPASPGPSTPTTGRVATQATVRGHLKRQRYGTGNALTRWIYVEGYQASRWVSPWSVTVVHGGGKPS